MFVYEIHFRFMICLISIKSIVSKNSHMINVKILFLSTISLSIILKDTRIKIINL